MKDWIPIKIKKEDSIQLNFLRKKENNFEKKKNVTFKCPLQLRYPNKKLK